MAGAKKITTKDINHEKDLDYFGILKNAFGMVRNNRYLWFLGILSGSSFSSYNFGSGNFDGILNQKDNNASAASSSTPVATADMSQMMGRAVSWMQNNWVLVVVIISIILILAIVFGILSNMAKAGLASSVDKLSRNEKSSFMDAMKFGWHKFWKVFGASILIGLIALGLFTVLAIPAFVLWSVKPLFIIYVILAIFVVFFLSLVIGITFEYTLRYIVLKDGGAASSIRSGFGLLKSKKKETALVWLITLGVGIVAGVVLIMSMLLVGLVLLLLGLLFFLLMPVVGVIYAVIAAVSFIVALFIAGGFINSLNSAYWTLCFKELETVK